MRLEYKSMTVALSAIKQTLTTENAMTSSKEVKNYLKILLANELDEWFAVLFLTSQHRLIRSEKLFRGTINSSHAHVRRP